MIKVYFCTLIIEEFFIAKLYSDEKNHPLN